MNKRPKHIGVFELRRHRFGDMPPLRHWDRSKPFDWRDSRVCYWLAERQPGTPGPQLFRQANSAGAIVFAPATGLWHGCYYGLEEADVMRGGEHGTKSPLVTGISDTNPRNEDATAI